MSSILKALKKLEEERAREKGAQVDLVQNILRGEQGSGEAPAWRLPLLVLGLLLAGGLIGIITVNWLSPSSPRATAEPVATVPPTQVNLPPTPTPTPTPTVQPPPVAEPAPVPAAASAQPVAAPAVVAAPPEEGPVAPGESTVAEQPAPGETAAPESAAKSTEAVPAAEQLQVSGIVYQEDPHGRMAVVNDLPVMEGTAIAGAVVEEILPDRVRFSRDGTSFEVLLQE